MGPLRGFCQLTRQPVGCVGDVARYPKAQLACSFDIALQNKFSFVFISYMIRFETHFRAALEAQGKRPRYTGKCWCRAKKGLDGLKKQVFKHFLIYCLMTSSDSPEFPFSLY